MTEAAEDKVGEKPHQDSRVQARRAAVRAGLLNALILTAIALSVWRAVALGADGVGAGTLIISAAGLIGISVTTSDKHPVTVWAVLLAIVLTIPLGLLGARYFADQPVDVTSQLRLQPMTNALGQTVENQYIATLEVPKSLNVLKLRLALVDAYPGAGSCTASTYQIQRLGALRPTAAVASDTGAEINVPTGISQLELLVIILPAPSCEISVYTESAQFIHE
jgi:hypothetical protein